MEPQSPEPKVTTPREQPETSTPQAPSMQTYQNDLAMAMDATDASVVQELLETARERESVAKDEVTKTHQRKWYVVLSIIFILLAIGVGFYGIRHYLRLTVPVQKNFSVGVFGSTEPYVATSTTIGALLQSLKENSATLPEGKPLLVPIVSNEATLAPVAKPEFFSFIGASPTEPLAASFEVIRLGVINTGSTAEPFIIASVPDPEVASKELLIAEPELLKLFAPALGIDLSSHVDEIGKGFTGQYLYNLPVRNLRYYDINSGSAETLLLYAYATEHTIVMTTNPEVLKAIYDTIIRQR